jgi:outer membrane lipoprotein-sorting protein
VLTLPPPCRRAPRLALVVLVALLAASVACAAPTAQEILRRALDLSAEVQDYTAQVQVRSNLAGGSEEVPPFTVYFKRPDKVSIKSRSLVIVPRDALTFGNLSKRIEQGADILLVGAKTVNGVPLYTLKIIPKRETGEERLLVVVDGQRWTVSRVEVVEGQRVHATFDWQHTLVQGRYWMPSVITCKVPEASSVGGGKGAEATVTFTGYKVNSGLSDSLFQSPGD